MEVPEIMDILMNISSRLQETEQFMQEAHKDKEVAEARRSPSPRKGKPIICSSRERTIANSKQSCQLVLCVVHS